MIRNGILKRTIECPPIHYREHDESPPQGRSSHHLYDFTDYSPWFPVDPYPHVYLFALKQLSDFIGTQCDVEYPDIIYHSLQNGVGVGANYNVALC